MNIDLKGICRNEPEYEYMVHTYRQQMIQEHHITDGMIGCLGSLWGVNERRLDDYDGETRSNVTRLTSVLSVRDIKILLKGSDTNFDSGDPYQNRG